MKKIFGAILTAIMAATMIGGAAVNAQAEVLTEDYSIASVVAEAKETDDNHDYVTMTVLHVEDDIYRVFVYYDEDADDVVTETWKIDKSRDGWDQLIEAFNHVQELSYVEASE